MDENNQNPYGEQNEKNWETTNTTESMSEKETEYTTESMNENATEYTSAYTTAYTTESPDDNKKDGQGFGIASMVLGIIALLCFCTGFNFILAILAIVFGIIQLVSRKQKGMAIAGLVTAALSMILCIGLWTYMFSNEDVMDELLDEYYRLYYDKDYDDDYNYDDIYDDDDIFDDDYDDDDIFDDDYDDDDIFDDDIDEAELPEFRPDYDAHVEDSL